jgi:hypothetical protein
VPNLIVGDVTTPNSTFLSSWKFVKPDTIVTSRFAHRAAGYNREKKRKGTDLLDWAKASNTRHTGGASQVTAVQVHVPADPASELLVWSSSGARITDAEFIQTRRLPVASTAVYDTMTRPLLRGRSDSDPGRGR